MIVIYPVKVPNHTYSQNEGLHLGLFLIFLKITEKFLTMPQQTILNSHHYAHL